MPDVTQNGVQGLMARFLDGLWRFGAFLLIAFAGMTVVGRATRYAMEQTSFSMATKGLTTGAGFVAGLVAGGLLGLRLLRDREPPQSP